MKQAKKKSVGRPKLKEEDRRKAIEVTLHRNTIDQARAIGGTVSRGVEMAVSEYWRALTDKPLDHSKGNPFGRFSKKATGQKEETIRCYKRPHNQKGDV